MQEPKEINIDDDKWLVRKSIKMNGAEIVYWRHDSDAKNDKPTLVLIHGLAGSHLGLSGMAWKMRTYNLILIDLPGCGESGAIRNVRSIKQHAVFLNEFVELIGLDNFVLIGHSTGANMALNFSYTCEALNPIVLLTPAVNISKWIKYLAIFIRKLMFIPIRLRKSILLSRPSQFFVDMQLSKYEDKLFRNKLKNIRIKERDSIDHITALDCLISVFDITLLSIAPSVRAQTLILGSGQDKLVKVKDIEKLSSQLHNSSLVIIEQSGHFVSAEEPTACADAISEFIDRTLRLQTPNIQYRHTHVSSSTTTQLPINTFHVYQFSGHILR